MSSELSTDAKVISKVLFRSDEATAEMEELARISANPDEINITSDDEEESGDIEGRMNTHIL